MGDAVTSYLHSEAFNDETIEYFISGFETLRFQILWLYPNFDLSMFKADAKSDSTRLEDVEGTGGGETWRRFVFPFVSEP